MRDVLLAMGLLCVGVAGFAGAATILRDAPAPRPRADGEVGELYVYGQTPQGPRLLSPGRAVALPRPQDFSFQLDVEGSGPRLIRMDVESEDGVSTLHEERTFAPAKRRPLEYVLHMSEEAPDYLALVITVEAPHLPPVSRRYPLRLSTREHPFWRPDGG